MKLSFKNTSAKLLVNQKSKRIMLFNGITKLYKITNRFLLKTPALIRLVKAFWLKGLGDLQRPNWFSFLLDHCRPEWDAKLSIFSWEESERETRLVFGREPSVLVVWGSESGAQTAAREYSTRSRARTRMREANRCNESEFVLISRNHTTHQLKILRYANLSMIFSLIWYQKMANRTPNALPHKHWYR